MLQQQQLMFVEFNEIADTVIESVLDAEGAIASLTPASSPSEMRNALYQRFRDRITPNPALDRTLVSFQANKQARFYGWFKYKEGFSEALVRYLLQTLMPQPGMLLDPFAGSGSALFAGSALGWETEGIEVLPVGLYAMRLRTVAQRIDPAMLRGEVIVLLQQDFEAHYDHVLALHHITITRGAFPDAEERQLIGYISYCRSAVNNSDIRDLLLYAAFCILEDISYTRKDGQYLRWDARSGRQQGKKSFNKGRILTFREAIQRKLFQILADLEADSIQQPLFADDNDNAIDAVHPDPILHEGSCLEILPTMAAASVDFVLTSPPYANRYDYTRTYALELVYLGCNEADVKRLRQTMLSCTVENKEKRSQLQQYYTDRGQAEQFRAIDAVFERQAALQEVLGILDAYRDEGKLNNDNIARLVRNYFYEMCFVVYELARALKPGGIVAMVNDNVRYAGEEIPVDLILSDMAESFDLRARHIWTLRRGKGNSSQQMGNHGRTELRKCVYIWEK